ncbi:hypothetical protein [Kitasatospora cheerisanensis]|uniref:Fibronectin type-III domain-containing protein n=1 Tax=Kitasatospora cheerisanensis KCTC 2395 TaxID=1348663 RepID=A0A066Z4Q8_9ACTN|nr:hypothetical protein [Kitasatospora cheerisanensis]KDN87199.1 hypothetical protein KCH_12840 [Kitasatospora cheerisanensis KCTC 2395]
MHGAPALLPVIPAVRDFPGWQGGLASLGVAHPARALLPPGRIDAPPEFRVLDGLWFPVRGHRWRRADAGYLAELAADWRQSADPRAATVLALLGRAALALELDPMALRRLTLYRLAELADAEGGSAEEALRRLGVHPAEAAELAAATAARPRVDRAAAEGLWDVWADRRLDETGALLARLPGAPSGDQVLDAVRHHHRSELAGRDGLLREAAASARRGERVTAVRCCLRAARLDRADRRPLLELVRIAEADEHPPGSPRVRAEPTAAGVELSWTPAARRTPGGEPVGYQVLRLDATVRPPGVRAAEPVPLATVDRPELRDAAVPFGHRVRYAVVPVAAGRPVGAAALGPPVVVAPPPSALRLVPGRKAVALSWTAPAPAEEIRVVRTAPDGPARAEWTHPAGEGALVDRGVEPGPHRYALAAGYRAADGARVWSEEVTSAAVVERYPEQVASVRLAPGPDGTVTVEWPAPAHGRSALVAWPDGLPLPPPGEELPDVSRPEAAAAEQLGGGLLRAELAVAPRALNRCLLVTALGGRAVAGPGVVVDAVGGIERATAERTPDGRVRLAFGWPEPAVLTEVRWSQGGEQDHRVVARSSYLREGLVLPVDRRPCTVTLTPVGRVSADLVLSTPLELAVPARLRVAWRLERPPRLGRRRPWQLRLHTELPPAPDGELPWPCPDFLLVAAAGTVRPLRPEQGEELLRVPGAELADGLPHRAELDPHRIARPAVLRGFLVGPHAGAAELQDPDPDSLVVR